LYACDVKRQRGRRARSPAMRVADAGIVEIRRVMQLSSRRVPFDEGRVGHARIIQHETPLQPHQRERGTRIGCEEVRLQFETRNEGRNGIGGFECRRTIGRPPVDEIAADALRLRRIARQVGDDCPCVSVLGMQCGRFVVFVHAHILNPQQCVGRTLYARRRRRPIRYRRCVVELMSQLYALVDRVIQNGIRLNIVPAHANP
jgi:hypothetical protein